MENTNAIKSLAHEAKIERNLLEGKLLNLICEFEEKTGLIVDRIEIERPEYRGIASGQRYCQPPYKVDLAVILW